MSEAVARINENIYVVRDRVVAVVPVTSTVSRRIRASNQIGGKMVNLSYGKECKSIIFMDSGHSLLLAEPALEVRKKIWG
ncbi:protein of unknown function [Fervidobacterium changbaicum]|uniref:DUF370 domain-containing protein n=2 Tax=Fervidobacterium TaxID=2422 RepID=A0AAI8GDD7_FERIS|nr:MULTISPECIES: extracellular matrix/biofilm biosynthesis regulator RemA family protein [Fervidobacterium]AMW32907.1 DUF370 domain-containing protein [Fervidobacterium islandicum]QAV32946.1 DUF370 domain-containing protein [Fervidobacterium changbaicum]SDH47285.1 protein of unknown function [Fervidobacterium changbaicum]